MKIAVVGSRTWHERSVIEEVLDRALERYGAELAIVSGGARGADSIGEDWARRNGVPITVHLPDWSRYGRSAGFRRNELIVRDADCVLAFQMAGSRGTQHSIDLARRSGTPVHVWERS